MQISPTVQNTLSELEIERKFILNEKYKGWGAIIGGVVLGFLISSLAGPIGGLLLGGCGVGYGIYLLYNLGDKENLYKERYKRDVIGATLCEIDPTLTFNHYKGILESEFRYSQLFSTTPDRYSTEDLVIGKLDKTGFYFAEVHAEYKTETQTKNGRRVTWHDILKGIIFVADFNKNFNGVTLVRPKNIGASISAWFSKNVFSFGDKNVVQLENDVFNKDFIVYSTDQVEARYILTPALMERIGDLNKRSAYTVSLSFIDSRMYIAFPLDHNYFEPPLFKTLINPELLTADINILNFMCDIIRELDLNTRIWTKQ